MGGYGFQTWREASELRRPVGEQRDGGHQKAGCSGAVRLLTKYEQQRQHLNGLAQSHVIGQAGPQAGEFPSAATSVPASMRMASRKLMPCSAAVRSISPKCSSVSRKRSASTSTQRPRTRTSPSEVRSKSCTSALLSLSPSRITSR